VLEAKEGQGYIASGNLGESLALGAQPKVKLFGQIYRMQITMADYGISLDEGRAWRRCANGRRN
jgi:hypothetical protein